MHKCTLIIVASLFLFPLLLGAQGLPTHDPLPIDAERLARHLVSYTTLPGATFDRDIEVWFISDPSGVIHSAYLPVGSPSVAAERELCALFNRIETPPSVTGRKVRERLVRVVVRFERKREGGRHVVINGERYSFPPLTAAPLPQPPLPTEIARVEGTSTPPGVNAQSVSMELNFAALSFQNVLEGEVVVTLIVEPDGTHGPPVRVSSTIPDKNFTAEVVAILAESETTPGRAERRPVRSMLEVRVICKGKEGSGGSSEQKISVAQRAPIPVPDGHDVHMEEVDIAASQQSSDSGKVMRSEGMEERAILDLGSTDTLSSEDTSDMEGRIITSEEKGSIVEVLDLPASYDPIELSENLVYPQDLMDARVRGYVVVNVGLDKKGTITTLDILDATDERFVEPALEAVRAVHYNPATLNGQGVESNLVISLKFGI